MQFSCFLFAVFSETKQPTAEKIYFLFTPVRMYGINAALEAQTEVFVVILSFGINLEQLALAGEDHVTTAVH